MGGPDSKVESFCGGLTLAKNTGEQYIVLWRAQSYSDRARLSRNTACTLSVTLAHTEPAFSGSVTILPTHGGEREGEGERERRERETERERERERGSKKGERESERERERAPFWP